MKNTPWRHFSTLDAYAEGLRRFHDLRASRDLFPPKRRRERMLRAVEHRLLPGRTYALRRQLIQSFGEVRAA